MKKPTDKGLRKADDMRPEYDFGGGVRGKYTARYTRQLAHSRPEVVSGEPVFGDTRVPVRSLVEWLVGGHTLDEFLDNFPSVTRDQAVAFLEQAAETLMENGRYP